MSAASSGRLQNTFPPSVRVVELPLTGGEVGALEGRLIAMAAGDLSRADEAFLLKTLAVRVIRFSRFGDPAFAKAAESAVLAYQAALLRMVAERAAERGVPPRSVLRVLAEGSAGCRLAASAVQFDGALLAKDWGLAVATLGGDLPVRPGDPANDLDRLRRWTATGASDG